MLQIDLSHKVALVTGASGQLGQVIARTLSKCGAAVGVHYYKNEAAAKKLSDEINLGGGKSVILQADITNFESIVKMRDQLTKTLGVADIVINNAVIQYGPWKEILEEDPAFFEQQFQSSVMHNVYMAKAFAPAMIKKKYGRIIGINSESSMQNFPGQSAYTAGKRGMDGVLRVLAKEIGEHQITVNQIAPGAIQNSSEKKNFFKSADEYAESVPLKRRGSAQETANVVAFIASDLASFVTGTYIPVCGGNVMPGI